MFSVSRNSFISFRTLALSFSVKKIVVLLFQIRRYVFYSVVIILDRVIAVAVTADGAPFANQIQSPGNIDVGQHTQQQPPAAFIHIMAAADTKGKAAPDRNDHDHHKETEMHPLIIRALIISGLEACKKVKQKHRQSQRNKCHRNGPVNIRFAIQSAAARKVFSQQAAKKSIIIHKQPSPLTAAETKEKYKTADTTQPVSNTILIIEKSHKPTEDCKLTASSALSH